MILKKNQKSYYPLKNYILHSALQFTLRRLENGQTHINLSRLNIPESCLKIKIKFLFSHFFAVTQKVL